VVAAVSCCCTNGNLQICHRKDSKKDESFKKMIAMLIRTYHHSNIVSANFFKFVNYLQTKIYAMARSTKVHKQPWNTKSDGKWWQCGKCKNAQRSNDFEISNNNQQIRMAECNSSLSTWNATPCLKWNKFFNVKFGQLFCLIAVCVLCRCGTHDGFKICWDVVYLLDDGWGQSISHWTCGLIFLSCLKGLKPLAFQHEKVH